MIENYANAHIFIQNKYIEFGVQFSAITPNVCFTICVYAVILQVFDIKTIPCTVKLIIIYMQSSKFVDTGY